MKNKEASLTEEIVSINRRGSDSVKWALYGDEVFPLWVADTDFCSPKAVLDALRQRVDHGVFGYPVDPPELGELVVERMHDRYGWDIEPEHLIFVPGVVPGFNLTCQAVMLEGESLLVQPPVYPPILKAAQYAKGRSIEAQLIRRPDGSYGVDFDGLEKMIEQDTRCFLLCNPHNPVGKVFTPDELKRMGEICLKHNMVICSDEIHSDLVFSESRHTPIAVLSKEIAQITVTLIAPSKTFNIAGLECAVLICENPELKKKIQSARRGLLGGVNVLGLTAAMAAYRSGDDWLNQMLVLLEENRNYVAEFLRSEIPQIKMKSPEATFLAWLDCRELDLPQTPYEFFLQKAGVALNRGEDFGAGGQGYVRLNFGCSRDLLMQALTKMAVAVKGR